MRIELKIFFFGFFSLFFQNQQYQALAQIQTVQVKPLLVKIQDSIARAYPTKDSYYQTRYRPEETRYWARIPGWMVEDAITRYHLFNRRVNKILDLGCGYGTLLAFATIIYGTQGICMDCIPYIQEDVQNQFNINFIKGDIERDSLPDPEKFDVIIMTEVLEHLNFQPVPTLRKIWNALADSGSFYLTTPDADAGWGRTLKYYQSIDEIPPLNPASDWIDDHIWVYNRIELIDVLNKAGFKIKRIENSRGPIGGGHINVWATK